MSSTNSIRYFEKVEIGEALPELVKIPTPIHLFRYSAVTWNAHRIHFEKDYAIKEGHPDVLVQAHLHGAYLAQLVMDWIGPRGRMLQFGWTNRARAVPGDVLTCSGKVVGKRVENGRYLVDIEFVEKNQRGETCAPGKAVVSLPSSGDKP